MGSTSRFMSGISLGYYFLFKSSVKNKREADQLFLARREGRRGEVCQLSDQVRRGHHYWHCLPTIVSTSHSPSPAWLPLARPRHIIDASRVQWWLLLGGFYIEKTTSHSLQSNVTASQSRHHSCHEWRETHSVWCPIEGFAGVEHTIRVFTFSSKKVEGSV